MPSCIPSAYDKQGALDVRDVRRANIRRLVLERFEGKRAGFARAVGAREAHINNVFSRLPEHRRNVGEKAARRYEEQLGLPCGWLDVPRDELATSSLSNQAYPVRGAAGARDAAVLDLKGLPGLQAATLELMHRLMRESKLSD